MLIISPKTLKEAIVSNVLLRWIILSALTIVLISAPSIPVLIVCWLMGTFWVMTSVKHATELREALFEKYRKKGVM